jgi:hypothetical protein
MIRNARIKHLGTIQVSTPNASQTLSGRPSNESVGLDKWRDRSLSVEPAGRQVARISTLAHACTHVSVRQVQQINVLEFSMRQINCRRLPLCRHDVPGWKLFLRLGRFSSMQAKFGHATQHSPSRTQGVGVEHRPSFHSTRSRETSNELIHSVLLSMASVWSSGLVVVSCEQNANPRQLG